MREILFRGKRTDNGEWIYGYYVRADHQWHRYGIHRDWIICGAAANGGWFAIHERHAVKGNTVGQYTDLKDKNGKRIFEGDILSIPFEEDRSPYEENSIYYERGEVYFDTERYGWYVRFREYNDEISLWEYDNTDIEVIGNIHDNGELLEVR